MLDIGWQELLVIGALALIVVGPKDLPGLLRTLGQYTGKIRGMAREFQRSLNDAARDSDIGNLKELREIQRDVRAATNFSFEDQANFLDSDSGLPTRLFNIDNAQEVRLLRACYEQYFEKWLDHPLEELYGRTPRELVRTVEGRALLEDMV